MRSHDGEGPKTFAVAARGYKRDEVDEYVARLHEWLLDSEARAENAVQAATAAVGERVTDILRAAFVAGEQTRKDAEHGAAACRTEGEARAAEIVRAAERDAAEVVRSAEGAATDLRGRAEAMVREAEQEKAAAIKNAQAEAERAVDGARREVAALQVSIDELTARKATVVAEVAKLQRYLAGAEDQGPADASRAPAEEARPGANVAGGRHAPVSPMTAAPDGPTASGGVRGPGKESVFAHEDRPAASA
jgi:DivIVA domain-containing protein